MKRVGNIEGAEQQLFQYAFHAGVPIAILTDGHKWRFFHPTAEGDYRERQVYALDIIEDSIDKINEGLNRYLNYERVCNGEAVRAIKADYQELVRQKEIEKHLPEAWCRMVNNKNEYLPTGFADEMKSLCGEEPTNEQMLIFLGSLVEKKESESVISAEPLNPSKSHTQYSSQTSKMPPKRLIVTFPDGTVFDARNATLTWVQTLKKLIDEFGSERMMAADSNKRVVAKSPNFRSYELYRDLYIAKDYSTDHKKRHLDDIAGMLGFNLEVVSVEK